MSYRDIEPGKEIPNDVNVVIEIAANALPVKYEVEKYSGALMVDRLMSTAMHYPCNYGYIPQTLCGDGDPADVLVVTPIPLQPGCIVRCRPLGVLNMEDEAGEDSKIIAVPIRKITTHYDKVSTIDDLPSELLTKITHFFEHYKDLEEGKWVKVTGWADRDHARGEILDSVKRYQKEI